MRRLMAMLTWSPVRSLPGPWLPVLALLVAVGLTVHLAPASASVRHARDTFPVGKVSITVERFEPEGDGRHPAVVLLHGLDGLWDMGDLYRGSATRLAQKGFIVFLPHYFDSTGTGEKEAPALMRRFRQYINDETDRPEYLQAVREPFEAWMEVVRAGVSYARGRENVDGGQVGLVGVSLGGYLALSAATDEKLRIGAVVEHFGGLPRCFRPAVHTMPPTLILHGDQDQTVPLREAFAVRDLLAGRKLPYEVKVYEGIGHVFMDEQGQITWRSAQAMFDAEERTAVFLGKHLRPERSMP